jgi:hypothetical protein
VQFNQPNGLPPVPSRVHGFVAAHRNIDRRGDRG